MFTIRSLQSFLLISALAATPAVASRTHRAPTAGHKASSHKAKKVAHHVVVGQRGIDADRAREIQAALIKRNYLTGEPTGEWDSATEAAMIKFQADHGWQTKLTPDSRAIIMLGLGPEHAASTQTASESAVPDAPASNGPAANTLASIRTIQN
ncbi:peptidoglycan-binding domain-containing protein [Silvibacterium acidisoli]|uniref:peptidoglycan-binding domain-containing protein n=1 Tax=Acidobacteriaceae bacterium ZG23-2 TaxID=2883246 RepID=UPI00406C9D0F